jgi:hypothetical protein
MKAVETDADELQKHMASTYANLRLWTGAIGVSLPLLLWFVGPIAESERLRASMSAYYYSQAMSDVFVGGVVAVGVLLYLYKGFSTKENWALNVAGACAIGVALFPTTAPIDAPDHGFTLHATFAVLFFLSIAYVCIFRASDTLSLIRDADRAKRLRAVYRGLGIAMLVSPITAAILTLALERTALTFFLEAVAIETFAAYWLVKTWELRATHADRLALAAKLKVEPVERAAQAPAPGRLIELNREFTRQELLSAA